MLLLFIVLVIFIITVALLYVQDDYDYVERKKGKRK